MGVLGLWQLLAPVGQPVTLESLENKIFAVDISIWLNQAIKGYRDSTGGSVPNAHLLSLFSRLCKLLFYKIRPIIVFDGGFPELKKQTIINRQQRRAAVKQNTREFGIKILTNYLASQQLGKCISEPSNFKKVKIKSNAKPNEEIFKMPPLPESSQSILNDSGENNEDFDKKFANFSRRDIKYLNDINIESEDFNALPADIKLEILSLLKETQKHHSWDQCVEMPEESNAFSSYQMQCLLKKRKLQSKLEEVQKDLRRINSSAYVSQYTNDHVIGETNKIMSDDASYYVLLKKIMKCAENEGKKNLSKDIKPSTSSMADTKSAFVKDIQNFDFNEDCFFDNFKVEKSSTERMNEDSAEIVFNSSDEEYYIDNPPSIDESNKEGNIKGKNIELEIRQKVSTKSSREVSKKISIDVDLNEKSKSDHEYCVKNNLNVKAVKTHQEKNQKDMEKIEDNKTVENEALSSPIIPCTSEIKSEPHHNSNTSPSLENDAIGNDIRTFKTDSSQRLNNNSDIESLSDVRNKIDEELDRSSINYISEDFLHDASSTSSEEQSVDALVLDPSLCKANLELQKDLDATTEILKAEQVKQDRQANTVQDHMIQECKELLQLFGIPYIVSPLEAEAQCAFYDIIHFTHGTITDDSDVWLFGGKKVYKNFFTQQKFVECYKSEEIFSHFSLSREKLINFALLTGSDYTEGIEGVGPVTAMEIISEFSGEGLDALQKFKDWWEDVHKRTRIPENKVREKLSKLPLPQYFPDEKVFDAYLNPEIDNSMEKFTWGRPDLDAIRNYTKERFGWNQSKVDSELLPVLKRLNERDKQMHLDSYFTMSLKKDTNLFPSKRIMAALKKMASPEKQTSQKQVEKKTVKRKSGNKEKVIKRLSSTARKNKKRNIVSQGPMLSEESSDES